MKAHTIESFLSRYFYRHGVFCASYPHVPIAITGILFYVLAWPVVSRFVSMMSRDHQEPIQFWEKPSSRAPLEEELFVQKYGQTPFLHLEQIIISTSDPASKNTQPMDVINKETFMTILSLQNHLSKLRVPCPTKNQDDCSLDDICFKPVGDERCLVHSPLEYWSLSEESIQSDDDILATVSNHKMFSSFNIPTPLSSVFNGLKYNQSCSGEPCFIGADQVVLTYFLTSDDRVTDKDEKDVKLEIWDALMDRMTLVPWNDNVTFVSRRGTGDVKHLYYELDTPQTIFTGEFSILLFAYILVFLYISLVVSKVDLVKSKFGLGFTAVVMIFSSLLMSVGLWDMLGVSSMLVPWEVLPFLVIAIGVENISVLTEAVVNTSLDLPVKERVGRGLSQVAIKMLSSVGAEMFILFLGSLISIRVLQEFCLYAAVSIVMDYFLQITFFASVLAIDIRRLELSELYKLNRNRTLVNEQEKSSLMGGQEYRMTQLTHTALRVMKYTKNKACSWSFLVIVLMMVILASLSGSARPSIFNYSFGNATAESELTTAMPVTADVFWDIIHPTHMKRYIEMRPPLYLDLIRQGTDHDSFHSTDSHHPTRFMEKEDDLGFHISNLSPVVSIVVVVGALICSAWVYVVLSGYLYMTTRSKLFGGSSVDKTLFDTQLHSQLHVTKDWRDVEKVETSDCKGLTVWEDGQGVIWAQVGSHDTVQVGQGRLLCVEQECIFFKDQQHQLAVCKVESQVCMYAAKRAILDDMCETHPYNLPIFSVSVLTRPPSEHEKLSSLIAIVLENGSVEMYPFSNMSMAYKLRHHSETMGVLLKPHDDFSPSSCLVTLYAILVGAKDGCVHCWAMPMGASLLSDKDGDVSDSLRYQTLEGLEGSVTCIASIAQDVHLVAAGSHLGYIRVWNIETGMGLLTVSPVVTREYDYFSLFQPESTLRHRKDKLAARVTPKVCHTVTQLVLHKNQHLQGNRFLLVAAFKDERVCFYNMVLSRDHDGPLECPSSSSSPSCSSFHHDSSMSSIRVHSMATLVQRGAKSFSCHGDTLSGVSQRINTNAFIQPLQNEWQIWSLNLNDVYRLKTSIPIKTMRLDGIPSPSLLLTFVPPRDECITLGDGLVTQASERSFSYPKAKRTRLCILAKLSPMHLTWEYCPSNERFLSVVAQDSDWEDVGDWEKEIEDEGVDVLMHTTVPSPSSRAPQISRQLSPLDKDGLPVLSIDTLSLSDWGLAIGKGNCVIILTRS